MQNADAPETVRPRCMALPAEGPAEIAVLLVLLLPLGLLFLDQSGSQVVQVLLPLLAALVKGDVQGYILPVPVDGKLGAVPGPEALHRVLKGADRGDRLTVHSGDDISRLKAGFVPGRAGEDPAHIGPLRDAVADSLAGDFLQKNAHVGLAGDVAMLHDIADHLHHIVNGNGEAQALHTGGGGIAGGQLGGGDAHHLSVEVEQGAAGVAGVDGGVGLNHVHHGAVAHGDAPVHGGDIPAGKGEGQLTQRIADGYHLVAHVQVAGLADDHWGEALGLHLEDGDVVFFLSAHQLGVVGAAVVEGHLDVADPVNDVVVGQNVPILGDDEPGAGDGVAHGLAPHVGGHVAADAHGGIDIGGVDLWDGQQIAVLHVGDVDHRRGPVGLINGGGPSHAAQGPASNPAGQTANQGAAQAHRDKLCRQPLRFPGGLWDGLADAVAVSFNDILLLRGAVVVVVIHGCALLF